MSQKESILIIVLNYNQNDYTLKCVDSLLESSYSNYRIVVVDNGSTPENQRDLEASMPISDKIILKLIKDNRGYVGGINYGLEQGAKLNPDFFLIMNNDTIIDKHAIDELFITSKDYEHGAIVSGKVYHYDEPNKLQFVGYKYSNAKLLNREGLGVDEIDNGQYDLVEERDMLDDIFWLFPAALYDEIGGYSPYFWFNSEQADFAMRAQKKGYKLLYTPKAKLWHKGSVSVGGRELNPRLAFWSVQSKLILKYLHLSKFDFWPYYFKTFGGILSTFLKSLKSSNSSTANMRRYAMAKYKGWVYFNKWLVKKNENTGYNPF